MMAMPPLDAALRLKNVPCEDDGPSHNHDPRGSAPLHLKNDFAVHDFVEPPHAVASLALVETQLQEPPCLSEHQLQKGPWIALRLLRYMLEIKILRWNR